MIRDRDATGVLLIELEKDNSRVNIFFSIIEIA